MDTRYWLCPVCGTQNRIEATKCSVCAEENSLQEIDQQIPIMDEKDKEASTAHPKYVVWNIVYYCFMVFCACVWWRCSFPPLSLQRLVYLPEEVGTRLRSNVIYVIQALSRNAESGIYSHSFEETALKTRNLLESLHVERYTSIVEWCIIGSAVLWALHVCVIKSISNNKEKRTIIPQMVEVLFRLILFSWIITGVQERGLIQKAWAIMVEKFLVCHLLACVILLLVLLVWNILRKNKLVHGVEWLAFSILMAVQIGVFYCIIYS